MYHVRAVHLYLAEGGVVGGGGQAGKGPASAPSVRWILKYGRVIPVPRRGSLRPAEVFWIDLLFWAHWVRLLEPC